MSGKSGLFRRRGPLFTAIATRSGVDGLLDVMRKHAVENAANTGSAVQTLAAKLRGSDAIDVATKFSLKGKVDRPVTDLERHHDGEADEDIGSLKQRFDRLIGTVVALLAGRDPALATDIAAMRQPLWQALKDPEQFLVVAMQ